MEKVIWRKKTLREWYCGSYGDWIKVPSELRLSCEFDEAMRMFVDDLPENLEEHERLRVVEDDDDIEMPSLESVERFFGQTVERQSYDVVISPVEVVTAVEFCNDYSKKYVTKISDETTAECGFYSAVEEIGATMMSYHLAAVSVVFDKEAKVDLVSLDKDLDKVALDPDIVKLFVYSVSVDFEDFSAVRELKKLYYFDEYDSRARILSSLLRVRGDYALFDELQIKNPVYDVGIKEPDKLTMLGFMASIMNLKVLLLAIGKHSEIYAVCKSINVDNVAKWCLEEAPSHVLSRCGVGVSDVTTMFSLSMMEYQLDSTYAILWLSKRLRLFLGNKVGRYLVMKYFLRPGYFGD